MLLQNSMVLQVLSLVPKLEEKEVSLLWELTPLVVFTFKKVWILAGDHDTLSLKCFCVHYIF